MRTSIKLAAYSGVLAVSFAGALGAGSSIGRPVAPTEEMHSMSGMGEEATSSAAQHDEVHSDQSAGIDELPGGVMMSANGYTLQPESDILSAGTATPLKFQILGADGEPLTAYEQSHDKDMHLIVVRSDTSSFQHGHPDLSEDGTWSAPVNLGAGTWRVFADFVPGDGGTGGEALTLGTSILVAGNYTPVALPEVSRTFEVDGYTVTLEGSLVAGKEAYSKRSRTYPLSSAPNN